ncbi:PucR family transcriptional regulator [Mycolicibacterium sp. CBM1]
MLSIQWLETLRPRSGVSIPPPGSSRNLLADAYADLGQDGVQWAAQLAAEITEGAASQMPELPITPAQYEANRRSCEAVTLTVLRSMARGVPASQVQLPIEVLYDLRSVARQGVPLEALTRLVCEDQGATYRALVHCLINEVPARHTPEEVSELADLMSAYIRVAVDLGLKFFATEQRSWQNRLHSAQRRTVESLIGGRISASEAERSLGIRLAGRHLGAVAWRSPGQLHDSTRAISQFAATAAKALDAEGSVVLEAADGATWVWWTWAGRPAPEEMDQLRSALPSDMTLAIGQIAAGPAGFARTHKLAQRTARLARTVGRTGLWAYDDIKLAALMTSDLGHARDFMQETLGELANNDSKTTRLRTTLYHYLLAGRSRVAAAKQLHLAPNTVAYRIRCAEELLPAASHEEVMNVLAALQVAAVLAVDDSALSEFDSRRHTTNSVPNLGSGRQDSLLVRGL